MTQRVCWSARGVKKTAALYQSALLLVGEEESLADLVDEGLAWTSKRDTSLRQSLLFQPASGP